MGEYAEHGIELSTSAMSLGYKVGSAKAQAEATIATTLEFVKSTIEGTARDAKAFTEKQDQVNKNLEGGVDAKLAAVDSKLETAATQQAAAAAQQKKEAEDAAAAQKKATEDALAKLKADLTADVKTQLAAGMMWVCVGVGRVCSNRHSSGCAIYQNRCAACFELIAFPVRSITWHLLNTS